MKTVTGVLAALIAVAVVNAAHFNTNNNNDSGNELNHQQLQNQQDILSLLNNVQSPNGNENQANIGRNFITNWKPNKFQNPQAAQQVMQGFKAGNLQKRGSPFSTLDWEHLKEAVNLFHVLHSAVDYSTFYAAACFARDNINEGQFVYAFYAAVVHRPDTNYLALPHISEVYPHLFVKASAIKQAQNAAASGQNAFHALIQQTNKSNSDNKNEGSVDYFREDISLNEHNFYLHIQYPFWYTPNGNQDNIPANKKMFFKGNNKNDVSDEDKTIFGFRGEIWFTYLQQTLARYNLERVANGLSEVTPIELDEALEAGFNSGLQHENGQAVPSRPANMQVQNSKFQKKLADSIKEHEDRIKEAIDANAFKNNLGSLTPINPYYATNAIMNCAESNPDCANNRYYGALFLELLKHAGSASDSNNPNGRSGSALEDYQTMIRDPAFFSIAKRVVDLVARYKEVHLQPYSGQELSMDGVKIESIEVSDLVTFNDNQEVNINNAVTSKGAANNFRVSSSRLNHKPFNIRLNVNSDKAQPGLVRIFIGSKTNQNGEKLSIKKLQATVVLLDKFSVQLQSGNNEIERSSDEFTQTGNDASSAAEIREKVQQAMDGNLRVNSLGGPNNNVPCGLPKNLQLPKGSSGQNFIFVIVTGEFDQQHKLVSRQNPCGNLEYFDWRPNLFPFDRSITHANEFNVPQPSSAHNVFVQYFCGQKKNNNMCRYYSEQQTNNMVHSPRDVSDLTIVPNAKAIDVNIQHKGNLNSENESNNSGDNTNFVNDYENVDEQVVSSFQSEQNKYYSF